MVSQLIFNLIIFLLIAAEGHAALENLDQMDARKARRATNTFYSGESSSNNWTSQPESLIYNDVVTGKEVHVLTNTPNRSNIYNTDISPANPWSADGARLGFFSNRPVGAFTRTFGSLLDGEKATSFVVKSNGSKIRPTIETSLRQWGSLGSNYFIWSPVIPDTFYAFGEAYNGLSLNKQILYRNTVSDTSGARYAHVTLPTLTADGSDRYTVHKVISPDGSLMVPMSRRIYYPTRLTENPGVLDADGWAENRGQSNDWGGAEPFATKHDMYFPSKDFLVSLFSYDGTTDPSPSPVMYKYNITGSAADGGPLYNPANEVYTNFGDEEAEPLISWAGKMVPFDPDGNAGHGWGHPGFDRWGRVVVFNDGNGYHSPNCVQEWSGPVAWDYRNRTYLGQSGNPQPKTCPQVLINIGLNYVDYNAWSDYFAYAGGGDGKILTGKYDSPSSANDWWEIVNLHGNQNGSTNYHWTSTHRPAQSPDGTKIASGLNFLTSVPNTGDIGYVVAYYPHPPEITSVTGSGTYTIRLDWRLETTPRGYTTRGWPDEATDNPPPPRETSKFRLWRSADGTTWAPITTVDANIFSRYNFATGDWTGNSYWEITDTPGAGTFYYAVTALEHSGLESRILSNVFSTAGVQTMAYPIHPKGVSSFYLTSPPWPAMTTTKLTTPGQYRIDWQNPDFQLTRYYNIYYSPDGTPPKPIRQNLIASVPVGTNSYVDWLADQVKEGKYLVTIVDSQGNESSQKPTIMNIRTN
ncbi:MAG: hypothetical protein JZU65_15980 [Chlorobium sp.]|nr:hypothetical protein [Chlorobium sp.]